MIIQKTLRWAVKASDPVIQEYISHLIEENKQLKAKHTELIKEETKLEMKISDLKTQNEIYKKSISALQKAFNKSKSEGGDIILHIKSSEPSSHRSEKRLNKRVN